MASQKWIFDPPPPPLPREKVDGGRRENNSGQRGGAYGRGQSGWKKSEQARHHGQRAKPNHQQQWQPQHMNSAMVAPFLPAPGFFPAFPPLQPPTIGFPPTPLPHIYPSYQTPYQYGPPQQYPVSQPYIQQYLAHEPQVDTRKLPIYQSQAPQQNSYGYSMSSTAFSLPSHHFDAQPEKPAELSEEQIRAALEKSRDKNKLNIPIEGTSIVLDSVEDVVGWREERKKKWLSKIAARDAAEQRTSKKKKGGWRNSTQTRQTTEKERRLDSLERNDESQDTEPDKVSLDAPETPSALDGSNEVGVLSEGEVFVSAKRQRTIKPATKQRKKASTASKDRAPLGPGLSHEKSKPINLRTALLQNQMERENIVLLQALLHLRQHGLLDLES